MVCDGIFVIRGNLNARRYINDIFTPRYISRHGPRLIVQKDNVTTHAARVTQNFLNVYEFSVLPWTVRFSAINPIEHLWDEFRRRVRRREPQNLRQVERALIEEWRRIPVRANLRLTGSMKCRCQAVISTRGYHTRC